MKNRNFEKDWQEERWITPNKQKQPEQRSFKNKQAAWSLWTECSELCVEGSESWAEGRERIFEITVLREIIQASIELFNFELKM